MRLINIFLIFILNNSILFSQENFVVESCHPWHIENGYFDNFFGVNINFPSEINSTVISINYNGISMTYTVSGVGYFSNENCDVKYIYVNDDFSDNFGIPLVDGVSVDIHGCTNAEAINFNQNASIEDNSCEIYGCTDENAINFNEYANIEDESCISNIEILFETIDSLEEIITEFENFQEPITLEASYEYIPLFLPHGWSMFGYTCNEPLNVTDGFVPIKDKIILVKDHYGNAYLPEWNFNSIGDLIFSRGYQIKLYEEINNFQFCPTLSLTENFNCPNLYSFDDSCYYSYFNNINLDDETIENYIINAARWREICEINLGHLKNPMYSIKNSGDWIIYYHIESWEGAVNSQAISSLTFEYQNIANQWIDVLDDFDENAPDSVNIKIFGFVFNTGVLIDPSFYEVYGDYPIVTNWNLTNEEAPWLIKNMNDSSIFNQNWYLDVDYTNMFVDGNRDDVNPNVNFHPENWNNYNHPEGISMFFTKFWHKTTWDAVAQRQYLKVGGQIQNYTTGEINYSVFAHEMGHCFFHDDIYDIGKYPNGQNIISIMNSFPYISDFDKIIQRMVWEKQKNL